MLNIDADVLEDRGLLEGPEQWHGPPRLFEEADPRERRSLLGHECHGADPQGLRLLGHEGQVNVRQPGFSNQAWKKLSIFCFLPFVLNLIEAVPLFTLFFIRNECIRHCIQTFVTVDVFVRAIIMTAGELRQLTISIWRRQGNAGSPGYLDCAYWFLILSPLILNFGEAFCLIWLFNIVDKNLRYDV